MSGILINIDVPALDEAVAFYTRAFGLTEARRFGGTVAELEGWPAPVNLLEKAAGSMGAAGTPRDYARHWTPVHLDVVVEDLDAALARAVAAGAVVETLPATRVWGRIAMLADPFGHGFCLIEFYGRGYGELTEE
jgi:predicted enzyme related to lactoylglutathione lyase